MKTTGSPVVFLCIKSNKQAEKSLSEFRKPKYQKSMIR